MVPTPDFYSDYMRSLSPQQRRFLPTYMPHVADFASNDYLNLRNHPDLIAAAVAATQQFGAGSGASRLLGGNYPLYAQAEQKLAALKGYDASLILNSGFQANATVIPALLSLDVLKKTPLVLIDRLAHASMYHALRRLDATVKRFHHNDMNHLETLLQHCRQHEQHAMVITESIFSMDGDSPDFQALRTLKDQYGFLLYMDEAHATGVYGHNGMGCMVDYPGLADVVMGTFGKALGCFGAYIAANTGIIDYLINRCAGLIYTTALPPSILGSIHAALDIVPGLADTRRRLLADVAWFRKQLGLTKGAQIIPHIIGDTQVTMNKAAQLLDAGFYVPAIRPPTVPPGTARLRISINAAHDKAMLQNLLAALNA